MRTVMIRLHTSRRIISVDMERIQMGADLLDRSEVLHCSSACLEDFAFGGSRGTGKGGIVVAGRHFIYFSIN